MKLYTVETRGKYKTWAINWYCDPKDVDAMREDGIEIFEIVNIVPGWIVDLGLMRPYIFIQDLWNFRWLKFPW